MQELGVYFFPQKVQARLRSEYFALGMRVATTLVISGGVAAVLWFAFPDTGRTAAVTVASLGLFWLVVYGIWSMIRIMRVRADGRVANGLALGLNRDGVMFAQQWHYWQQIGSLAVKPGTLGASEKLILTTREAKTSWIPLDYTDANIAVLEQSVRLFSAGLAFVDLSKLDV
jgi:hypothetical protein